MKTDSAKYLLVLSIECCLDAAHHIIASEGFRVPKDYFDTFKILNEKGIVPDTFMPTLRRMVRFRNRLVHLYWEVDDHMVYQILQDNLRDFETFVDYVLDFIRAKGVEQAE